MKQHLYMTAKIPRQHEGARGWGNQVPPVLGQLSVELLDVGAVQRAGKVGGAAQPGVGRRVQAHKHRHRARAACPRRCRNYSGNYCAACHGEHRGAKVGCHLDQSWNHIPLAS